MMFVTLSLILLAFFILLNSMATLDEQKHRQALGSLLGSFGLLPGANAVDSEQERNQSSRSISAGSEAFSIFKKLEKETKNLAAKMSAKEGYLSVSFDESTGDIKVVLAEEILFAPGTAVISPRVFPLLAEVATMAREVNAQVKVSGHTDSVGKRRNNWELSIKRGTVVARHLEAAADYPKGMLSASGAAHYRPVDEGEIEETDEADGGAPDRGEPARDKALERRVEILVRTKKE